MKKKNQLCELGREEFFNLIRNTYQKPTASIIVNGEKLLAAAFNIVLEAWANPIKQEKEMYTDQEGKSETFCK